MLIAIRADAASHMGVGHVTRCLALAEALQEAGARVLLLTRDLGHDVTPLLGERNIATIVLPRPERALTASDASVPYAAWAGVTWETDVAQCLEALGQQRPQWMIVDHYAFDQGWHEAVRGATGARIAAIDDLADRQLAADVVIDQNPSSDHGAKFAGRLLPATRLLGGTRYALLARRYRTARPIHVRSEVNSIGIFMGGTDAAGLSAVALRACRERARFEGLIEVVTTSGNPELDQLAALTRRWPRTELSVDRPDLVDFFSAHDVHIGAGGGASWERCCLGVPTVALTAADNQQAVLPELAARNAALVLDYEASPDVDRVGAAVSSLIGDRETRERLARNSRDLVDGLGAVRCALFLCREQLSIREARMEDAQRMHEWRNHPVTRAVSRNPAETSLQDHERWLQCVLADANRSLLIARVGQIDVGVVRFDRQDGDAAEVSIYLDPALHGLGLGRKALLAAERHIVERHWPVRHLIAEVLESNRTSQQLFAASGYEWSQQRWRKRLDRNESARGDDEHR